MSIIIIIIMIIIIIIIINNQIMLSDCYHFEILAKSLNAEWNSLLASGCPAT